MPTTSTNTILHGDALARLRELPDACIQCCVTSPPYFGLRSYLPDGHADKSVEIGLEETPEAYIQKLVEVFREVRRVLKDDGTTWINIGDSYTNNGTSQPQRDTSGGFGGRDKGTRGAQGYSNASGPGVQRAIPDGLKPKDLIGIPWMLAFALRADGYYLRSDLIWHKPNCIPESVKDRPTKSHEYVFLLSKSERYFYDGEAIKEGAIKGSANAGKRNYRPYALNGRIEAGQTEQDASQGRNRRSVWSIPTRPFSEAHFATFPEALVEPCILAGSQPGDIVLDPFSGAGTVPMVAAKHGRSYLGIELNAEYIQLAHTRLSKALGMWQCEEVAV